MPMKALELSYGSITLLLVISALAAFVVYVFFSVFEPHRSRPVVWKLIFKSWGDSAIGN
jgi:hypothetical protein